MSSSACGAPGCWGAAWIDEYLDADLRPYGLDLGEYEILVSLSEAPDRRLRMSELALAVHQSRSRLTHTVARMETRRPDHAARARTTGAASWPS